MNPSSAPKIDLTRTTLNLLAICALLVTSAWILSPFLPALLWATMVVVATWPLLLKIQQRCGSRRGPAVVAMTLLVLLVLVAPLSLAIATVVDNADRIVDWGKDLADLSVSAPPDWLGELPWIGEAAKNAWSHIVDTGHAELAGKIAPYAGNLTKWFVREIGNFGLVFVQFLLTVALAAVLFMAGERHAAYVRRFGRRLAGERGDATVVLAGQAIRAVALGVGITALVQSLLGGIGLAIAGLPAVALLTALMFMFCIAQLGPGLVLIPAVIWLYWSDNTAWAIFLLIWSLVVMSLDNFLRPFLIRQGADLPMLLILAGVIGGMLSFGLVGIFIGPVVLAVAYTLLQAWLADAPPAAD